MERIDRSHTGPVQVLAYRSQLPEMARSAARTVALDNGGNLGNSVRLRVEHLGFMIPYISM